MHIEGGNGTTNSVALNLRNTKEENILLVLTFKIRTKFKTIDIYYLTQTKVF